MSEREEMILTEIQQREEVIRLNKEAIRDLRAELRDIRQVRQDQIPRCQNCEHVRDMYHGYGCIAKPISGEGAFKEMRFLRVVNVKRDRTDCDLYQRRTGDMQRTFRRFK